MKKRKHIIIIVIILLIIALLAAAFIKRQTIYETFFENSDEHAAQRYADKSDIVEGDIEKGSVITIDSKEYRVLDVDGTVVKVIALYDAENTSYDEEGESAAYFGSEIDRYLNGEFYESLDEDVRNAIVETEVTQYGYGSDSENYSLDTHASCADVNNPIEMETETVKVFIPDVSDIEEYFEGSYSAQDLMEFFNEENYFWLRSSGEDLKKDPVCAWAVDISSENSLSIVYSYIVSGDLNIRPMFFIDLSRL